MSSIGFRMLSFVMKRMKSPEMIDHVLQEVGIIPGQTILDYACGPGLFTINVAKRVGPKGHVYAADLQPLAKKYIEKKANKAGVSNISVLITNGKLDIPDATVDVTLLFDVIHYLQNQQEVFREIHRVLKVGGNLAVDVHHSSPDSAIQTVKASGFFKLIGEKEIHEKHSNRLLLFTKSP